jgi:hypothetical protein
VEKINKAREKRRESKAPEAAGGSEGGASLKERGRSLSDDNDSAEALKDTSTNSGGRAVDPPRRRLRKVMLCCRPVPHSVASISQHANQYVLFAFNRLSQRA